MKKWLLMVGMALMLSGCGAEETMETVSDVWIQTDPAEIRAVSVALPPEAVSPALQEENGSVYFCGDYEIYCQILDAGDLRATVQSVSGYLPEDLTVIETKQDDCKRYDLVWAAAGETGDRVCQARILDDGNYHYCLSVMADAEGAHSHEPAWQAMFDSFALG